MPTHTRISVLVSHEGRHERAILRGVQQYAQPRTNWIIHRAPPASWSLPAVLDWEPQGLIVFAVDAATEQWVLDLDIPAVNVSGRLHKPRLPRVRLDDAAIGRAAAEHFLERGFRHFGFVGVAGTQLSDLREQAFRAQLTEAGFACTCLHEQTYTAAGRGGWKRQNEIIANWLESLPKPAAVFAAGDYLAIPLIEACMLRDFRVPEEIALLGADNDDILCEMTTPPLSSVETRPERVGFEAAALLDRLLHHRRSPKDDIITPVGGVVTRQSSDILAIGDHDLAQAIRFIRLHAHEPIGVQDVLAQVPLSRRALERRFLAQLKRTPLEEIRRVRLQHAGQLLASTEIPISAVAQRAGFGSAERLAVVFRQHMGVSPLAYRRTHRPA